MVKFSRVKDVSDGENNFQKNLGSNKNNSLDDI